MLRRRFVGVLFAALLCLCTVLRAAAADPSLQYQDGEVLFASRYADYSTLRDTGVYFGTSSWSGASAALSDGELRISSSGDQKTYLLLPSADSWTDTYTVRYTFRFTDIAAPNGYCAFLLTSWGDAPSNRTELVLRASGSCDGFGSCGEALSARIAGGEAVTVTVPIRHGMLFEITVSSGEESETFRLSRVKAIAEGNRGFALRNASAAVSSVEVIAGTDFDALSGYFASHSYVAPPSKEPDTPDAPPTADAFLYLTALSACAAAGAFLLQKHVRRGSGA